MFRLLLLISTLMLSFALHSGVNAAVTYTPGAVITMTGSNSDVRFDVASDLFGFDATIPALTTGSRIFTGAFYASGIGWIEFSTGTYQVGLDCGAQVLSGLTMNCTLTGTGWSENVGDVYFSSGTTIIYNPTTGLLSGSVISFAGDLDLTGIALPLRPVSINESGLLANHSTSLTISGAWMYDGGSTAWNMGITPIASLDSRMIPGTHGTYIADLSLATQYDITITDTNGSETEFSLTVNPGLPIATLESGSHYGNTFCTSYSADIRCPDGATRIASSLVLSPFGGPIFANGVDTYSYTMKVRDSYGNRVESGNLKIRYLTTVKNVQVDISDNMNYGPSIDGDAFISSDLGSGLAGFVEKINILSNTDTTYTISSFAPTNTTDNIIKLDYISYLSGATWPTLIPAGASLAFSSIYSATVSSGVPTIGVPHLFLTTVTQNDIASVVIPTIISTLKIGDGMSSEWRTLSGTPLPNCTNYPGSLGAPLCDWTGSVSSIATTSDSNFTFTGVYTGLIASPPLETTAINTYVYYMDGATEIFYPLAGSSIVPPGTTTQRLRVFGQTTDGMNVGSQNRVNIINDLREKIALLARNRTDFTAADYVVYTGDQTVTDAIFATKRSIIVVGGDITIDTNITLHSHPLVLIALTNTSNQGGNIRIKGSVTDIHSSLIAEHALVSETSPSQLYIHGSIIAANPPREVAPTDCPYFAPSGCVRADYDLPDMRSTYTPPMNASVGGAAYLNPLIIEVDTRLIGDPPPVMSK